MKKDAGHLRTRRKRRKHKPQASVFYISRVRIDNRPLVGLYVCAHSRRSHDFENDVTITVIEQIRNEYEERSAPKRGNFLAIKVKYYTTTPS